jgi:hypothetical protein
VTPGPWLGGRPVEPVFGATPELLDRFPSTPHRQF